MKLALVVSAFVTFGTWGLIEKVRTNKEELTILGLESEFLSNIVVPFKVFVFLKFL